MRVEITCMDCGSGDLVISGNFMDENKRTIRIRCKNCNGKAKISTEVDAGNFYSYLKAR